MSTTWDLEAAVLKGLLLRRGAADGDVVAEAIARYEQMASDKRSAFGILALLDLEGDVAEILSGEVEEHVAMLRGMADWLEATPPAERLLARQLLGDGLLSVPQLADALRRRHDLLELSRRHGLFQILLEARAIRAQVLVPRLETLTVLECPDCQGIALQLPQVAGEAEEIETCGKCMVEMTQRAGKVDPANLTWADYEDIPAGEQLTPKGAVDLLADKERLEREGKKRATGKFGDKSTRRRSRRITRATRNNLPSPPTKAEPSNVTWIVAGVLSFFAVVALIFALLGN